MEEEESVLVLAEVPCSRGGLLHFSWGTGQELRFCDVAPDEGATGGTTAQLAELRWGAPSSAHRRVTYDMIPEENRLQQSAAGGRSSTQDILHYSAKVRQILRDNSASAAGDSDEAQLLLEHAVWQLLEIFFLDSRESEGHITQVLVQWLSDNAEVAGVSELGGGPLREEHERLLSLQDPSADASYWPVLLRLMAVGRIRDVAALLDVHVVFQRAASGAEEVTASQELEVLEVVYTLLRSMPWLQRPGQRPLSLGRAYDSSASFLPFWKNWQTQCINNAQAVARDYPQLAARDPALVQGAQKLLAMMGGTTAEVVSAVGSWAEAAVGVVLHSRPQLRATPQLSQLVKECCDAFRAGNGTLDFLQDLFLAAIEQDAQRVVEVCSSSTLVSSWLLAHMFHLLEGHEPSRGILEQPIPYIGSTQAEHYRLLHAEYHMNSPSSLPLTAHYLAWCPRHGAPSLEAYVERQAADLVDPRGPYKILQLCRSHQLHASCLGICRAAAMKVWREGQLGSAITWLLKAKDFQRVGLLAGVLVQRVKTQLVEGAGQYDLQPLDLPELRELSRLLTLLDAADSDMTNDEEGHSYSTNSRLSFLAWFAQLQEATADIAAARAASANGLLPQSARPAFDKARGAAMIIVKRRLIPKEMIVLLLLHLVPLMEAPLSSFTVADLQLLRTCLLEAEIAPPHLRALAAPLSSNAVPASFLPELHLALSRCLARTFLNTATRPHAISV